MKSLLAFGLALALAPAPAYTDSPELGNDTRLRDLQPDTSLFLLQELRFPQDDKALSAREFDGLRRIEHFQFGQRVQASQLRTSQPYCTIALRRPREAVNESIKRFQVIETTTLRPRNGTQGVSLELSSIQETSVLRIACFRPKDSSEELTVKVLREALGGTGGEERVALLGPLRNSTHDGKTPPKRFRQALSSTDRHRDHLRETHKSYLRYIRSIKDDQVFRARSNGSDGPPLSPSQRILK